MNRRILVTGASGTIGSKVVQALKTRELNFSVMSSKNGAPAADVPTVVGNFADPNSLSHAFKDFDTIFLLVPLHPQMIEFGKNAVDAAKSAGVRHIVRSSGAGANSSSPFLIAQVHGEIDQYFQQSGMDWTLLCPNSFMQNFLSYYREQIRHGAYYMPHGEGAISLVDVVDIAESVANVLANPTAHIGKTYTLTGGEALTDADQMAIISTAIGRTVSYIDVPEAAAVDAMAQEGFPEKVIEMLMSLNAVIKAGYAAGISGDVERLTGHPPRTFAEFSRKFASAWK